MRRNLFAVVVVVVLPLPAWGQPVASREPTSTHIFPAGGQRGTTVKVRVGGGLAGHNGLRSINASHGPDFRRVRIGIGHPGPGLKHLVTPHVLGNYAKSEMEPLSDMLAAIASEAEWLADGDDARFMSEVARRMQQAD